MSSRLDQQQNEFIIQFESWLQSYLKTAQKNKNYSEVLLKSQEYSLMSGGKRFRPFLAYLVFGLFSTEFDKIKNLCLSLEMIHTYSLIHDDLPCMDNDDFRRGKPTNHKVFSEDISLLAGDGLLTDVFYLLAADERLRPAVKVDLIAIISEKIGSMGMVSGQALDMKADNEINFEDLSRIHKLKTANLIQASAVGAALVADCSEAELHNISEFSYNLGMAFQIKDDLLDFSDKVQDFKNYPKLLGLQKANEELILHSESARQHLELFNKLNTNTLMELVEFNLKRNS